MCIREQNIAGTQGFNGVYRRTHTIWLRHGIQRAIEHGNRHRRISLCDGGHGEHLKYLLIVRIYRQYLFG